MAGARAVLPDLIEVRIAPGELGAAHRDGTTMEEAAERSPDPFTELHRAYARGVLERFHGGEERRPRTLRSAADAARAVGARGDWRRARPNTSATPSPAPTVIEALTRAGRLFAEFPAGELEAGVVAALRDQGGSRRRAAQTIGALTPREREVAALIRRGRTARQIAEELHLSPRTVESHLAHIYAKLGIPGREALEQSTGSLAR